jgi:Cytosol aminopeptidase family, N-terminal domain
MAEPRRADIAVAPLTRALLEGVDDGSGGPRHRVDLAVLPFFEDERPLQGLAGLVDWRTGGSLSALLRRGFCTGAAGEAVLLPGRPTVPMDRLVLLGLGPSRGFDRAAAEAAGERLVTVVEGLVPREVLVAMPGRASERAVVEAVFDGLTRALAMRAPKELDAQAQRAAKAVGDESRGPGPVGPRSLHATASPPAHDGPLGPRPVLVVEADRPMAAEGQGPAGGSEVVSLDGSVRGPAPLEHLEPDVCRWWVVADPRHEARLRRLLDGPPRAAEPGT